jgi:hypothetical protein
MELLLQILLHAFKALTVAILIGMYKYRWCVVCARSCGLNNKHVVYMLKVTNGDKNWICEKRYSGNIYTVIF